TILMTVRRRTCSFISSRFTRDMNVPDLRRSALFPAASDYSRIPMNGQLQHFSRRHASVAQGTDRQAAIALGETAARGVRQKFAVRILRRRVAQQLLQQAVD